MVTKFKATTTSAEPPDIDGLPGIFDAKFLGVSVKENVSGKFGTEDKFIWNFGLIDSKGKDIYDRKTADPVEVDMMTGQNMNVASKTVPGGVKVMKALLTATEFKAFEAGELELSDEDLIGRKVELDLFVNDEGWLRINEVRRSR